MEICIFDIESHKKDIKKGQLYRAVLLPRATLQYCGCMLRRAARLCLGASYDRLAARAATCSVASSWCAGSRDCILCIDNPFLLFRSHIFCFHRHIKRYIKR